MIIVDCLTDFQRIKHILHIKENHFQYTNTICSEIQSNKDEREKKYVILIKI